MDTPPFVYRFASISVYVFPKTEPGDPLAWGMQADRPDLQRGWRVPSVASWEEELYRNLSSPSVIIHYAVKAPKVRTRTPATPPDAPLFAP